MLTVPPLRVTTIYMQEKKKRRLRMYATPTGKQLQLQERDIRIFQLLNRYHYLPSTSICQLLTGKDYDQTTIKRLGKLFHDGNGQYIGRPYDQWHSINARYTAAIYDLQRRGLAILKERGLADEESPLIAKGRLGANRQVPHQLMIDTFLSSVELEISRTPGLRFISYHEILASKLCPKATKEARNPFQIPVEIRDPKGAPLKTKIVPDGIFGIEYTEPSGRRSFSFFFLEAERTNSARSTSFKNTSFQKKVVQYRAIAQQKIYQSHFGIPNMRVLTVMPFEEKLDDRIEVTKEVSGGGSSIFLFRTLPTLRTEHKTIQLIPDILSGDWRRAGKPGIRINVPQEN